MVILRNAPYGWGGAVPSPQGVRGLSTTTPEFLRGHPVTHERSSVYRSHRHANSSSCRACVEAVPLFSSFLPLMTFIGLPSARRMLARHLPGSRSNACRKNRLYSMSDTTEIFDGIKIEQKGKRYVAKTFDSLAHIGSKRDEKQGYRLILAHL
jgi:hypothetical protein